MDIVSRKLYMREHSSVIRKWTSMKSVDKVSENQVFHIEGPNRIILMNICRIRQRILTQAWSNWLEKSNVKHDYEYDARAILSRKIPNDHMRTELEIEVLFNWIKQVKDIDPTGIASTIYLSKSRIAIYNALQQIRLEFYGPGESVLFQGDFPRPEDGHFTIFKGECDVLQFSEDSIEILKLSYLIKKKKWDDAKRLLESANILAKIPKLSGFGELSTLTGVKRAATIRTSKKFDITEILVLPKNELLEFLKSKSQSDDMGYAPSEAMDFMRQSGLANRISPKDLVKAAESMIRRTLLKGDILFYKGQKINTMYLVVSGEFLLDTGDYLIEGTPQPFLNSSSDSCYLLSSGSILGDEFIFGSKENEDENNSTFESSALVVSDAAVIFEATNFGLYFLREKLGALRYCALLYKDQSRWEKPHQVAEELNLYNYFNSLRKMIAYTNPYRGASFSSTQDESNAKIGFRAATSPTKNSRQNSVNSAKTRGKNLQKYDSRLSFLLKSYNQDSSLDKGSWHNMPKQIKGASLHHALEIRKVVRKKLNNLIKVHAKENILYEELLSDKTQNDANNDSSNIKVAFKQSVKAYNARSAIKAKQLLEKAEIEKKLRNTPASSAIRFFSKSSYSANEQKEDNMIPQSEPLDIKTIKPGEQFKATLSVNKQQNIEGEFSTLQQNDKDGEDNNIFNENDTIPDTIEDDISKMEEQLRNARPKIDQYFNWLDSLNRRSFFKLLEQAEEAAHTNQPIIDEKMTKESIHQLSEIFRTFGLTPVDLNIPWRPLSAENVERHNNLNSMTHLNELALNEDDDSHEHKDTITPLVHLKKGLSFRDKRSSIILHSATADELEEKKLSVKVANHYKGYNHSSWKEELIKNKSHELEEDEIKFDRAKIPDNRRVMKDVYVIPEDNSQISNQKSELSSKGILDEESSSASSFIQKGSFISPQDDILLLDMFESPLNFINAIKNLDFNVRREYLINYEWNTRFLRLSQEKKNSNRQFYSILPPISSPSKTVKSSNSFLPSKFELIQSVKKIQSNNKDLKASLNKGITMMSDQSVISLNQASNASYLQSILNKQIGFEPINPNIKNKADIHESIVDRTSYALESFGLEIDTNGPQSFNNILEKAKSDNFPKEDMTSYFEIQNEPDNYQSNFSSNKLYQGKISEDQDEDNGVKERKEEGKERETLREGEEESEDEVENREIENVQTSDFDEIEMEKAKDHFDQTINSTLESPTLNISLNIHSSISLDNNIQRNKNDFSFEKKKNISFDKSSQVEMRFKDLRKRLIKDKPPSVAIEIYKEYLQSSFLRKMYFEGKKKYNELSQFKFDKGPLSEENSESFLKRDYELYFLAETSLFNSLFPMASKQDKLKFKSALKEKFISIHSLNKNNGINFDKSLEQFFHDDSQFFDFSLDLSQNKITEPFQSSTSDSQLNKKSEMTPKIISKDSELKAWQDFTIDIMRKEKADSINSLPSLAAGKSSTRGKTFGSSLISKSNGDEISGPSSYLEIYKNNFKVRSTKAERDRVAKKLKEKYYHKKVF